MRCKHCNEGIHMEGDTRYHDRDRYTWCRHDRNVAEPQEDAA